MRSAYRLASCILTAAWLNAALLGVAPAAPFVPTSDAQVLERLPSRASDPRARELQDLRSAWRGNPKDLGASVKLARAYFNAVAAEGDPRYIGYAQAALAPWWDLPQAPTDVRVLRAILHQFDHRFEEALVDLDAAIASQPNNVEAWSWRAAIHMVQANYPQARRSCEALAPLTSPLIAAACAAQVDATTGRAAEAAVALRKALQAASTVTTATQISNTAKASQRLWVLTRLAETEERRGAYPQAEAAFREALALNISDIYLLAAYADFLLDQGRAAEVPALLKDRGRADVLLLRQALAAQALNSPDAAALARELGARFDAARLRGDVTHRKEESRYVRAFGGAVGTANALKLGIKNFEEQREPADARILMEAAIAAKDPAAAEPALKWMTQSGIDSVALKKLAAQLPVGAGSKS